MCSGHFSYNSIRCKLHYCLHFSEGPRQKRISLLKLVWSEGQIGSHINNLISYMIQSHKSLHVILASLSKPSKMIFLVPFSIAWSSLLITLVVSVNAVLLKNENFMHSVRTFFFLVKGPKVFQWQNTILIPKGPFSRINSHDLNDWVYTQFIKMYYMFHNISSSDRRFQA